MIKCGTIAGIGLEYLDASAIETIDARGAFAVPGFIDGHLHIESSMMSPFEFEKMTSNGFQLIKTINPVTSKQISSIESANNGLNIYRAKLVFGNGQIQYSSPSSVLVFGEQYYYLFPNPLVQGNVLKLMSKEIDSTSVMIFDLSGRKVHQQVITGFIENISMPLLPKGMYYAIIQRAGLIQRRIPFIIL